MKLKNKIMLGFFGVFSIFNSVYSDAWLDITQAPTGNDVYAITSGGNLREMNGDFSFDTDRPDISSSNIIALISNSVTGKLLALASDGSIYSRDDDSTTSWSLVFTLPGNGWIDITQAPTGNDVYAITSGGNLREMNGDFAFDSDRPDISSLNIVALTSNSVTGKLLALASDGNIYSRDDDSTTSWSLAFSLPEIAEKAEISIVDGFIKLDITSGSAPLASDCSNDSHDGRMVYDNINNIIYICGQFGWEGK